MKKKGEIKKQEQYDKRIKEHFEKTEKTMEEFRNNFFEKKRMKSKKIEENKEKKILKCEN